jgi:hypothetical protein
MLSGLYADLTDKISFNQLLVLWDEAGDIASREQRQKHLDGHGISAIQRIPDHVRPPVEVGLGILFVQGIAAVGAGSVILVSHGSRSNRLLWLGRRGVQQTPFGPVANYHNAA